MKETHILIVGTGAVGAFYGSRLHQPDSQVYVSFTCRSNYAEVKRNGLMLETKSFGNYRMVPHQVFSSIDEAAQHAERVRKPWTFVFLCTKVLPGLVDDPALVEPLLTVREPPTLVLIQNGVGFEDLHRSRHPSVPLLSAVTLVNAEQLAPGLIRQNHIWTRIAIGPYIDFNYSVPSPRQPSNPQLVQTCQSHLRLLSDLFIAGGIKDVEIYPEKDLQILRWHKLLINATMNPSSVLSGGLSSPEMVSDPGLREHLRACMEELELAAQKIFQITRFPAHLATIDRILNSIEKAGQRSTTIRPSMLADWQANRPLEIEAILGTPIRIAAQAGVKLHRIHSMYTFLNQIQLSRSKKPASPTRPKI